MCACAYRRFEANITSSFGIGRSMLDIARAPPRRHSLKRTALSKSKPLRGFVCRKPSISPKGSFGQSMAWHALRRTCLGDGQVSCSDLPFVPSYVRRPAGRAVWRGIGGSKALKLVLALSFPPRPSQGRHASHFIIRQWMFSAGGGCASGADVRHCFGHVLFSFPRS